jgi:PPK2 family polyphosphate:nucleotide phosphotransferase
MAILSGFPFNLCDVPPGSGRERHLNNGSLPAMARDLSSFVKPFVVDNGKRFKLRDHDPDRTRWVKSKSDSEALLSKGVEQLCDLQDRLYAQDKWGVLLIFQAMDAAGKDGAIKHVMSGINPQGCQVYSFKSPSSEELDHDFLWRTSRSLPERGRIGIFNRSYYEETLVVRVHPEFLKTQKLPPELVTNRVWDQRFEDINGFERYLARNGYVIRKFFLHVSRGEQKRRFLERLDRPEKNWKFSLGDAKERNHWDDYMAAYQDLIRETSTSHAPWVVVPADTSGSRASLSRRPSSTRCKVCTWSTRRSMRRRSRSWPPHVRRSTGSPRGSLPKIGVGMNFTFWCRGAAESENYPDPKSQEDS